MLKERLKRLVTFIIILAILFTNINIANAAASLSNIGSGTIGFANGTENNPIEMKFGAIFEKECRVNLTFYKTNGTDTTDRDFHSFSNITRNENYSETKRSDVYEDYFSIMSSISALSDIHNLTVTLSESDDSINFNITVPYIYNSETYNSKSSVSDSTGKEYFKAELNKRKNKEVWDYEVNVKVEQLLYDLGYFDLSTIYDSNTNDIVTESSQYNISNINITHDGTTPYDANLLPYDKISSYYYSLFTGSFNYFSDNLYFPYKKDDNDNKMYNGQVLLKYDTSDGKFKLYFDTDKLYDSTDKVFENKYAETDFLKTGDILDKDTIYGLYNFKYDYTCIDCHWDSNKGDYVKTEIKNANLIEYTGDRSRYLKTIIFDDGRKIYLGERSCASGNYIFDSDKKYLVTKIVYCDGTNYGTDLEIYLSEAVEKIKFKNYFTNEVIKEINLTNGEPIEIPDGYYNTWVDINNKNTISSNDILNTSTENTYIGIPLTYKIPVYSSHIKDNSSKTKYKKLYEVDGTLDTENMSIIVAEQTVPWNGETYLYYEFHNTLYNVTDISGHSSHGITPHYFKGYGRYDSVRDPIFLDDGSNGGTANDGLIDDEKSVDVTAAYSYGIFYGDSPDEVYEIDNTSLIEPCADKSYIKCNPASPLIETNSLVLNDLDPILNDYDASVDGKFYIEPKESTNLIIEIDKLQEASSLDIKEIKNNYNGRSIDISSLKSTPIEDIRSNPNYVFEDAEKNKLNVSTTLGTYSYYTLYYDSSNSRPTSSNYLLFRGYKGFNYTLFEDEIDNVAGHDFTNANYSVIVTPSTQAELNTLINGAENKNELGTVDLARVVKIKKAECKRDSDLCTNPKAYKLKIELSCLHENTSTTQDNVTPAKCTVDGSYAEVVTCNDCHTEISRTNKKIDKLGHDWSGTWQTVDNDSRTQELFDNAENSGDLNFSSLGEHDTVEKLVCKRDSDLCTNPKAYKIKVTTHHHTNDSGNRENEVSADCTHDGSYDWVVRCTSCNDIISSEHRTIDKLGHTWGTDDWTIVNNPTQSLFEGADNSSRLDFSTLGNHDIVSKHECTRAQDAYQLKVDTHQHTNGDGVRENEISATCTQDGSYNWVVKCATCGDIVSTEHRTITKTKHTWGNTWQKIPTNTDINTLIAGAENKNIILNSWVDDNYHRLQIQYCTNTWNCVRGSSTKAYRLRVLKFEFKYDDDNDNDGKPDVTIDVIEEPKEDGEQEQKIDEIDTIVTEKPIVNPVDPEVDDPYVPYIVIPEDNPYDYDYEDERDYRIPTATINVSTNYWKTFLNAITFDIFFKDTQTGTINYAFKNPSEWDVVKNISYVVSKQGVTYNDSEIKNVDTWTDGTSFTLTKEDVQKYVAYAKIKLAGGYKFYISSNGMVMDSVSPTIIGQTEEDVILFSEEKFTIEDNTKLDKVFVDGEELSIVLNGNGNKTEIVIENDGQTHTIKAIDKAGNEVEKSIKFDTSDFIATVEGYIKDIDGKPVANAKVELRSTPRTTTTDENGKFTFTNVEVDRHTLKAFVNDNKIYEMSLALTPTYVKTELTDVQGTYTVSSDFTADSTSLVVRVNANECENHVHGHEEKENEVNPTCTKSGGYDLVDYCPNCGCEYKRTYTFIDALGHIWEDSDWVLVDEKDITDDLLKNAENLIDKKDITNKHKLYKRLCHRALDAYELKLVESTDTETKPEKTPENKPEETPENKPENTQPPKTEEIPTPSEDNTSIDSENNKQEDIPEDVETVDIEEDEAEEEDKSGSQKLPDEKSENKAVSKNPKTGDINIYIYLIMIAVGFGILIFATRKKKNN